MYIRSPPEGIGRSSKGSSRHWGRNYDNRELFPLFGVSDYESLLVKLAEIGVRPYCDDLNKRVYVDWHKLPDDLVVRAEAFYRDDSELAPNLDSERTGS